MKTNSKIGLDGAFTFDHIRNGEIIHSEVSPNIVVDEGLIYALGTSLGSVPQKTNWYMGLYSNNYTPVAGDTGATIVASAAEVTTAYDEGTRPVWTPTATTSKTAENLAQTFTFNTPTTVYGGMIISGATKGSTTDTLFCATKFAAARNFQAADILQLTYKIIISDV
jgi:hypothetical protein